MGDIKWKTEEEAIFLNPFTISSACIWKFVRSYLFANGLNGQNGLDRLNGLAHLRYLVPSNYFVHCEHDTVMVCIAVS
jgi:hypothetical protein